MATTTQPTTPSSHPEPFAASESSFAATNAHTSTTPASPGDHRNLLRPEKSKLHTPEQSPKFIQARLSPGGPAILTGVAAMAEAKRRKQQQQQQQQQQQSQNADDALRQTSPNPQVAAMHSLMGTGGMSKPTDAPTPNKMSEPLRNVAENISVPDPAHVDNAEEVSPVSLGSFGNIEGSGASAAMTATANDHHSSEPGQFVAEPADMTEGGTYHDSNGNLAVPGPDPKNISYTYPGPPSDQTRDGTPARGMSLPGYGQGSSPKSPASTKRHKCPYCATDFTRHHNLKSHLLTHSQEKPYVCQTCQARFRRLHDLKRHTKLHTGERPHTCDKCGRKFARGDALARHNKGPGGCAGRRSSLGGDDEYPEGMEGVEYDEGDEGSDEQGRRTSEPNRKRQQLETPQDPNRPIYRQHSSTYPPAPTATMRGNMGPPQVIHPGSNSAASPREMSGHPSPAGGSSVGGSYYGPGQVFAEPGMMTQSPRPLSPGQPQDQHRLSVGEHGGLGRHRSTSLTTQFQQQNFGRQSTGRTPPPAPPSNAQFTPGHGQPHAILPPIGQGGQAPSRGPPNSMSTQVPNIHNHAQHPLPGNQGSNPSSLSSHGRSSGSSMRELAQDPNDIWGYVRNLESRFSRMQDEYELRISRLQKDVISLKGQMGQMSNVPSYNSDMGRQYP